MPEIMRPDWHNPCDTGEQGLTLGHSPFRLLLTYRMADAHPYEPRRYSPALAVMRERASNRYWIETLIAHRPG